MGDKYRKEEIKMCMDINAYAYEKDNNEKEKEELKQKARSFGCGELSEEQVLFFMAQLEKEFVLHTCLRDKGLEFVNERTRKSISADFDRLIFAPENKEKPFREILDSLLTDENGEIIGELFTPKRGKRHDFTADLSAILPPCGNIDSKEGANPFDKESWNMAKQSNIYRENPEIAKYLAAEAKRRL